MTVTELREALQKLEAEGRGHLIVYGCDEPTVIPAKANIQVLKPGFVVAAEKGWYRDIRSGEIVREDVGTEFIDIPERVSLE